MRNIILLVLFCVYASYALDADATDVGAPDAGALDADATDAGALDAGALDADATDAGALDAGALDADATDADATDADATDADATDVGALAGTQYENGGTQKILCFSGESHSALIDTATQRDWVVILWRK